MVRGCISILVGPLLDLRSPSKTETNAHSLDPCVYIICLVECGTGNGYDICGVVESGQGWGVPGDGDVRGGWVYDIESVTTKRIRRETY
jgi:hypothetical protein